MDLQKRCGTSSDSNVLAKLRSVTERLFYARNSNNDAIDDIRHAISLDIENHRLDSNGSLQKLHQRRTTAVDRIKKVKKTSCFCFL
jgi:hypothetical protein